MVSLIGVGFTMRRHRVGGPTAAKRNCTEQEDTKRISVGHLHPIIETVISCRSY